MPLLHVVQDVRPNGDCYGRRVVTDVFAFPLDERKVISILTEGRIFMRVSSWRRMVCTAGARSAAELLVCKEG